MAFTNKQKTYRISILGILSAIILLQTFVPFLGALPIPPLNIVIIHITVIVATLALGMKEGVIIGGVWGVLRMIKAYTIPSTPLDWWLWTNPVITLLPRLLIGVLTALAYRLMKRSTSMSDRKCMAIAATVGAVTNTTVVLLFIYLFYGDMYAQALNIDTSNLAKVLLVTVATNGVAEAVLAAFIAPMIVAPLKRNKIAR